MAASFKALPEQRATHTQVSVLPADPALLVAPAAAARPRWAG